MDEFERNPDIEKWMPLWIAEVTARTYMLDTIEFTSVMRLALHAWSNGCELPETDKELARIAGISLRSFQRKKAKIIEKVYEICTILAKGDASDKKGGSCVTATEHTSYSLERNR